MTVKPRRVVARLLDRLSGLIPNVRPIVFDYTPEMETAGHLRAEHATRGAFIAGRVQWEDEPVPYIPTGKVTA